MATAEDVLNVARSLIGVHEDPDGSNIAHPITDWARQYGYSTGDMWCAWTVSYEAWHVDPALLDGMAPTGYSGAFRAWGEKYRRIISNPLPGAIDVMNFDADPSFTDHVGIVESVHSGYWTDIEGNHKNKVMRQDRSFADGQHWFILPKYSAMLIPVPVQQEEDDDEVYEAIAGQKVARVPAMLGGGKKTYLDITDESFGAKGATVRIMGKCEDNGDWTSVKEKVIEPEESFRFEVGQFWNIPERGGVTVKVEVLKGGPVTVTRRQTMGG